MSVQRRRGKSRSRECGAERTMCEDERPERSYHARSQSASLLSSSGHVTRHHRDRTNMGVAVVVIV